MKRSAILIASSVSVASLTAAVARAETVSSIAVEGAVRTSAEFVRSHITIRPNAEFASSDIDESIRQLYALGQFSNVRIDVTRKQLLITVEENKLVNQVVFNGNRKIKDDKLALVVKTKPTGPYDDVQIKADIEAIKQAYAATGRTDVEVGIKTITLSPDYVNVAFTINEGEKAKIDSINFIGNNSFSAERLAAVIGLKKSNWLSFLTRKDVFLEEKLDADKKALAKFYTTHGFADFEILSAEAHFDPAEKSYAVTFTMNEGPRYSFGKIDVLSNIKGLPDAELQNALKTKQGERYNADRIEASVEGLTNVAATQGFPFAKVTPRVAHNLADNTISLEYQIDQGEKSYIERIVIRGNTRTRDYVIRREFDVSEGDAYNRQMIEVSKRRLEALGFFKSVEISATQGSAADRVVLTVDVEDSSTGSFGIGAGASSDGPVLEASIEENNFLGRGQYIKLAASGGWDDDDNRNYSLAFTEPYFLGYHLAAGFDLNYSETSYDDYDLDQAGVSLRVTAPINEQLASTFRYNLTYLDYSGDSSDLSDTYQHLIDDGPWVRSSVSNTLTFNSLDSAKQPRSGVYATLTEELAGLGGDSRYFKVTGKFRYYDLLAEDADVIGSLTLGGGQIFAFGDSLNTFDQFSLGGNEIRGFAKRGIGARIANADDQTLGGSSYFYGSAEVTFPIPAVPRDAGLRGAVFADAGTLFSNKVQALGTDVVEGDDGSLRASIGIGLVWDSPFGALRVDYALPLAYEESDELERFKLGVNSAF